MSRFQFVADNSATFEVKRLCELVEIERSSYYAWVKAAPARDERARADVELAERIRAVHAEDNTQGAPRTHHSVGEVGGPGEGVLAAGLQDRAAHAERLGLGGLLQGRSAGADREEQLDVVRGGAGQPRRASTTGMTGVRRVLGTVFMGA
ncbi:hypothetical protein Ae717Ps2_7302 [Pseudonocardia sp. Ae717_Ps2]|nr:hypothetical protein Ae717Ps2_7302 [Pseudonocardia sp. Ae717_Ps2]